MKFKEFKLYLEAGLVSSVRVMPVPWEKGWCIDVVIKKVMQAGSSTDVLESDRSTKQRVQIRRFASLDSAAKYLKQLGVSSFLVDQGDSFIAVEADGADILDANQLQTAAPEKPAANESFNNS